MEWNRGNVLKKIGLNPSLFLDSTLSFIFKKPMFDLMKFERYIREKHGEYDGSLNSLIKKYYPSEYDEIKSLFLD